MGKLKRKILENISKIKLIKLSSSFLRNINELIKPLTNFSIVAKTEVKMTKGAWSLEGREKGCIQSMLKSNYKIYI